MILKYGSTGRAVLLLQQALNQLGANILEDGKFFTQTTSALQEAQARLGLPVTGQFDTKDIAVYEAAIKAGTVITPPSSQPPATIPAPTNGLLKLPGVDTSHYDGLINWAKARDQGGIVWAIAKALEGFGVDDQFKASWVNMKNEGIIRGPYCFFHPAQNPKDQADRFVNLFGADYSKDDLPPSLDWETTDGLGNQADDSSAQIFVQEVEKLTGRQHSLCYSSVSWIPERGAPAWIKPMTPWIADYNYMPARIPAPWVDPIKFVQYSGNGNVPGLDSGGQGDVDVFLGTLADLKQYIASTIA